MPLQTPTAPTPPGARLARAAIIVAASAILAGATDIARAADQLAPQVRTIAEPTQPVAARCFDVEANKANSMRGPAATSSSSARTIARDEQASRTTVGTRPLGTNSSSDLGRRSGYRLSR